jgi:hypothetical protein
MALRKVPEQTPISARSCGAVLAVEMRAPPCFDFDGTLRVNSLSHDEFLQEIRGKRIPLGYD